MNRQPKALEEHSHIIGGSSVKKRLNCTASCALEADIQEDKSPPETLKGSALHDALYRALAFGEHPPKEGFTWQGKHPDGEVVDVEVTADDITFLYEPAYEAIKRLILDEDVMKYDVELRVVLRETCGEDVFGTLDFVGKKSDGTVVFVDFKFGQGIKEYAEENEQLALYAIGMWEAGRGNPALTNPALGDFSNEMMNMMDLEFIIIQPFRGDDAGLVDRWKTTTLWLENFRQRLRRGYLKIINNETAYKAGPWCTFCKAKPICPERNRPVEELALEMPQGFELPKNMSLSKLADLLDAADIVEPQIKALRAFAKRVVEGGHDIRDRKLIQTQTNREWKNEQLAAQAATSLLGTGAFEPQRLRSVAQMEHEAKRQGKDFTTLKEHVTKRPKGTAVVHVSKKGKAIQPATAVESIDVPFGPSNVIQLPRKP